MSYILEAIRRSEDERRKRLVPDVSTIHVARPAAVPSGSRLLSIIVGAGLALGLAEVAWLHTRSLGSAPAGPSGEVTAPAAGVEDEPGVAAAGGTPVEKTAFAASPPRPSAPPARQRGSDPGAGRAGEASPLSPKTAKPGASRPPYSPSTASPPVAAAKVPSGGLAAPQDAIILFGSAGRGGAHAPAAAPLAELRPGSPAEPEFVSAIALRDLPEPVRQSLPDIAISLHRYASSAEARQVRVNGRAVREGDTIGDDLSVAEITRGGVVFAIGEQRFYMSAFQNWRSKAGP